MGRLKATEKTRDTYTIYMNITIDGTPLLSRKFGIGYYSENIIQALSETDYTNVYKILYQVMRSSKRELPCPPSSRFEPCVRRLPLKVTDYFFNTKNFSADFYCGSPDVFHGLSMFLPRLKRAKTIWTVHD
ncbi:MAG: hypothetical protein JKX97_07915, partial [Candidatus Lindowbacteria bacterium]|nr:hypothetical protein [Candidatus Lindowbacteria bacterium]